MKKILLLPVLMACAFTAFGQGTLRVTSGASIKTTGGGYIVFDNMHMVNDGSFQQSPGNGFVKFTGGINTNISGSSAIAINGLLLNKSAAASINLQTNLTVLTNVTFTSGLLNLNDFELDLGTTGNLVSESQMSRTLTTGIGYVKAARILLNPVAANPGNLGAIITTTDNLGHTIIRRGHKQQTAISPGNNSILRYYDIEPLNNVALKATLRFHYFDAELSGISENSLYQWRSKDMINWAFVGADSRDVNLNYVQRMNHPKFDRVTLAKGSAPLFTNCPANMTVSSNAKGCNASVTLAATASGTPAPVITYRIGNTVITSPHVFSKGTTTVSATAANGIAPDATCTFTVTVVCGPVNTLVAEKQIDAVTDEALQRLSLAARPNPTGYYFTIDIKSTDLSPVHVRVVDILGRPVATQTNVEANSTLFFGHKLSPGVYLMEAVQGKQKVLLRLVKN